MNWYNKLFSGFIMVSAFLSLGTITIFEKGTINADGSGTLALTYTANTSDVKKNNDLIGSFPFEQKMVKEYFSSGKEVQVKNISIYPNKTDTTQTSVSFDIDFRNINSLSELKGFSNNKISYNAGEDNNRLFRWVISPESAGNLEQIRCVITFECESLSSSNGSVQDKTITFFRDNKKSDFSKEVVLGATIKTDGKTALNTDTKTEAKPDASGKQDVKKKTEGEGKSCGLFGLELPLILLSGLVFSYKFRRKKNN